MLYARIVILIAVCSIFFAQTNNVNAGESELDQLKKQMLQMQKNMENMSERIEELENINNELKSKIVKEKQEKPEKQDGQDDVRPEEERILAKPFSPKQRGTTFLDKAFQTFNPNISVMALFAAAYYSNDDPAVLAEADPENTGVNLQKIEVAFQSVVDPYFKFDSFISFSTEGVELEEAYGTSLLSLPLNSQIRAGKLRSKFGRVNTLHRHFQNFVTLPVVASEFLGEHLNPTSVEANFLFPLPWFSEFSASVGSPDVETASFNIDSDANNLSRLLYVFHLGNFFELSDALSLSLGASYATGANGTRDGNRTNLFGANIYAKYRPLRNNPYQAVSFQSELMFRDAETSVGDIFDYGFYTQVVYKFMKRWSAGVRFGLTDTDDPLEFHSEDVEERVSLPLTNGQITQYSEEEDEHEEGVLGLFGKQYRISGMLTFTPSEYSVLRLQYDYTDQQFDSSESAVFLQFQYAIGAHAAHPF